MGITLDDRLDWAENSATLRKKAHQRLFFLKKQKSFKVIPDLLEPFYHSTTESVVIYNSLCFYSSLNKTDTAKLSKVTRTASKLIGSTVVDLQAHFERRALQRLRAILADPTHPVSEELTAQTSARVRSGRLVILKTRTNRLFRSFLPSAIRLFNAAELGVHNR